jgi:putative FmdB family regulatory protein
MPTYEYQCEDCGCRFERQQSMSEQPISECPECAGRVRRLLSGGAGFLLKGSRSGRTGRQGGECSLARGGTTCCGREERCAKPPCEDNAGREVD